MPPWSKSKLGKIHNRCRQTTGGFGCVFFLFITYFGSCMIASIGEQNSYYLYSNAPKLGLWWTYFAPLTFIAFFIWIIALVWVWSAERQEKKKNQNPSIGLLTGVGWIFAIIPYVLVYSNTQSTGKALLAALVVLVFSVWTLVQSRDGFSGGGDAGWGGCGGVGGGCGGGCGG